MGLTKISTDGVKDDAITKAKIPADQIESSELATGCIDNSNLFSGAVVNTDQIVNNAVTTNEIADEAVTLAKLPHGDANNDGKFLRANNGADPTFESLPASGVTVSNNANNRVVTGDGTNLNAEANLSYDESKLIVKSSTHDGGLEVLAANNNQTTRIKIQGKHSGGSERNWFIEVPRGSDILNFFDDTHGSHTQLIDNGNLSIVDGNLAVADGHGIDFSATGSPTNGTDSSELLNDYEEGSWTPTVTFGGNSAGQSYSYQVGQYVKVGRLVHIQCYVAFTNIGSSTGTAKIAGLPYATKNLSGMFPSAAIAYFHNGNSSAGPGSTSTFMVYGEVNETNLNIQREEITDSTPEMNDAHEYNFANNTDFMVTMTYVSN